MRRTWDIYTKSNGTWSKTDTIYRPNDNFLLRKLSTQIKIKLADGDDAYITPSTKYTSEPLGFVWYYVDDTLKAQIEGYINAQTDLKIIDHNNIEYIGRFINVDVTWIVGEESDKYDIRATFERMPSIA